MIFLEKRPLITLRLLRYAQVTSLTRLEQVFPGSGQLHPLVLFGEKDGKNTSSACFSLRSSQEWSAVSSGKNVAPDDVLRIRICALRTAANRLMEEGFSKL